VDVQDNRYTIRGRGDEALFVTEGSGGHGTHKVFLTQRTQSSQRHSNAPL
jgi:hypothetical protein